MRSSYSIRRAAPGTIVLMWTDWGQRMVAEGDCPPHVRTSIHPSQLPNSLVANYWLRPWASGFATSSVRSVVTTSHRADAAPQSYGAASIANIHSGVHDIDRNAIIQFCAAGA
jgi:hypothetical protein